MNSFEEFKDKWLKETANIKIANDSKNFLFVIMYPDKLQWDFGVEKQLQTTCLLTSGGMTGAGIGHKQVICYKSELNDVLKEYTDHTHAMIVSCGMVFDGTYYPTTIERFNYFAKSDEYCKGHIIAKKNQPAFLHHQHIELNLEMWRELGSPYIFDKWTNFERANDNFHDDYTPSWIKVEGLPIINNFSKLDRKGKAWSYGHLEERRKIQLDTWKTIQTDDDWQNKINKKEPYFDRLLTRCKKQFYVQNTEKYPSLGGRADGFPTKISLPTERFDLIVSPSAGYITELFANNLDFDGEIVFYDYCQENINIKRNIVEMNMSIEEIKFFSKTINHPFLFNEKKLIKDRLKTHGNIEELKKLQMKMYNNYDIQYWVEDLIKPDYSKLIEMVSGKRVFMNTSNIFSYHMSHLRYTLDELFQSFFNLHDILDKHCEYYFFRGTMPTKQKCRSYYGIKTARAKYQAGYEIMP